MILSLYLFGAMILGAALALGVEWWYWVALAVILVSTLYVKD